MKKILLSVAVLATMLASCSQAQKAKDQANDFKSKIENCSDPDSLKMYVRQAVAYADSLKAAGKDAEAEDYLNDIQTTVTSKDASMATFFDTAKARLDTEIKADSIKAATEKAAKEVADSAASKAGAVKDAAVDAAKDAASKVSDAASKGVDKAKDAANSAADKAKSVLGK